MMVESMAPEFSLWPAFVQTSVCEADAIGRASNSFSGFLSRASDVSPFSSADHFPGLPVDRPDVSDSLLSSVEAANTAELLALLQQQPSTDEHAIDAQIECLLQMKQALHRQKQQSQHQAMRIMEDQLLMVDCSAASCLTGQSSSPSGSIPGLVPSMSMGLEPSLPLDSSSLLMSMQSHALDLSTQDWAWSAGTAAPRAAQRPPARHSIDLGGLAQRLAALEMASANAGLAHQQQSVAAAAAAAAASAAAAAATLASTGSPFGGSVITPAASAAGSRQSIDLLAAANRQSIDMHRQSIDVRRQSIDMIAAAANRQSIDMRACAVANRQSIDMRACAAANRQSIDMRARQSIDVQASNLAATNLALQSALYAPTALSAVEPALPAVPQAPASSLGLGVASPQVPTGRLSLDVTGCSSLYHSTASPMGALLLQRQQQQQGTGLGEQHQGAAWSAGAGGAGGGRQCINISTNRRASIDVPLSTTPNGHCPPRKSCSQTSSGSSSSSSSSRNSPTGVSSRQPGAFGASSEGGGSQRGSKQPPIHQAPKWAGSRWHPMADVVKSAGQLQNKGTGVFIPPGMKLTEDSKSGEDVKVAA